MVCVPVTPGFVLGLMIMGAVVCVPMTGVLVLGLMTIGVLGAKVTVGP